MTCSHCVASVREEVSEVAGVGTSDVDLRSGRLVVSAAGFTDEAVRAAVAEAGYGCLVNRTATHRQAVEQPWPRQQQSSRKMVANALRLRRFRSEHTASAGAAVTRSSYVG